MTAAMRRMRLPLPDPYTGPDPCTSCRGVGFTGDVYRMPAGETTVLLVDVFCPACLGCGQAGHATCTPRQHADWRDSYDPYDEDAGDEDAAVLGETCLSCDGPGWNAVLGFPPNLADGDDGEGGEMVHLKMPCGCAEALMVEVAAGGQALPGASP